MDNLEKKLINIPKHKLRLKADLKIKTRLYKMIILEKVNNFSQLFVFKSIFLNRAMIVALMVFMILGSTAFYAYGSERITLGDKLYPLKLTLENVKDNLTPSSVSKVKNYNNLSTRRLEEALILSNKQKEVDNQITKTIDRAVENVGKSVAAVKKIDDSKESEKATTKVKENSNNNLRVLEKIEKNINHQEHQELSKKIDEAKESINQYNNSFDNEDDNKSHKQKDKKDKRDKRDE